MTKSCYYQRVSAFLTELNQYLRNQKQNSVRWCFLAMTFSVLSPATGMDPQRLVHAFLVVVNVSGGINVRFEIADAFGWPGTPASFLVVTRAISWELSTCWERLYYARRWHYRDGARQRYCLQHRSHQERMYELSRAHRHRRRQDICGTTRRFDWVHYHFRHSACLNDGSTSNNQLKTKNWN